SRNQIITLLVSGLWHGAAWTFVSWGLFHGVMLVLQRQVGRRIKSLCSGSPVMLALSIPVQILLVFALVAGRRVRSRSPDFTTALAVYRKILSGPYNWGGLDGKASLALAIVVIASTMLCEAFVEFGYWRRFVVRRRILRAGIAIAVFLLTL